MDLTEEELSRIKNETIERLSGLITDEDENDARVTYLRLGIAVGFLSAYENALFEDMEPEQKAAYIEMRNELGIHFTELHQLNREK